MTDDDQKYDKLDQYLHDKLIDADRQAFEQEMDADPDLKEEARILRDLQTALGEREVISLEKALARVRRGNNPGAGNLPLRRMLMLVASAAAIALLGILGYRRLNPGPESPSALFAYAEKKDWLIYQPVLFPEADPGRRSAELGEQANVPLDSATATQQKINRLYQEGRYAEAAAELEKLGPALVNKNQYHYYLGTLYLRAGNAAAALTAFDEVQPGNDYFEIAQWNRTMALVLAGNVDAAINAFYDLAAQDFQPEKARTMIQRLERLR